MSKKKNRTDRILILLALAILLGSAGLFSFDDWMWGGRRRDSGKIGVLSSHNGDVRMKFTGDLKWSKASTGQDLIYNDSIYVGDSSEAHLALGESEMTVNEKTLVVLRKQNDTNFMNLSYGNLFGKIAKGEKLVIDTGDGHPIELQTKRATEVVVRKVSGKTELQVVSGEAEVKVDGKKSEVTKASRIVVERNEEAKVEAKVEEVGLELVRPLRTDTVYSETPAAIDFQWKWSNSQTENPSHKFKIEFSSSPDFQHVAVSREVAGKMTTQFKASQNLNYYYRVKGPRGQISSTEKVNFVRMQRPVILQPLRDSVFESSNLAPAAVGLKFERDAGAKVNLQVAADPEFKNVVSNESTSELSAVRSFTEGQYYLRAQADYGAGHVTSWTDPIGFTVNKKPEPLDLGPELTQKTKVLIPNREYPEDLYKAQPGNVASYLSRHGLLRHYFPVGNYDQLDLKVLSSNGGAQTFTRKNVSWPSEKLKPGSYAYSYRLEKQGFAPSVWSKEKKLDIAMEPPRPLGKTEYTIPDENGVTTARFAFTPLLFAKSYDVELGSGPELKGARAIEVYKPEVAAQVRGENHYRVRARDAQGRLISEFSPVFKLEGTIPPSLAKAEPAPSPRKPAAVESTSQTKIETQVEEPIKKNGWWAWVGGGENYVDYKQTAVGRLTFDDHHIRGVSEYAEAGFIGDQQIGAVLSASFTPGTIEPDNANIDHNNYTWTTISIEALARRAAAFSLFGTPVDLQMRLGLQQNTIPFVFVDAYGDVFLKNNQMTTASVGLLAEMRHRRWTYITQLRYEYPFSTRTDGAETFTISPVVSFSGTIGAAYNLTQRLRLGVFANGQLQEFHFDYSDGVVDNHGLQSIFFSNMDLRLGYEF